MVNMITALCGYFSGTFVSDTGGTFKSDTPGTFVSDIGGTFEVILSGWHNDITKRSTLGNYACRLRVITIYVLHTTVHNTSCLS